MNLYTRTIRSVIKAYPAVIPHLTGRARWVAAMDGAYNSRLRVNVFAKEDSPARFVSEEWLIDNGVVKTYDYYLQQLTRLITSVYNGNLGGEFIDIMANLIQGQIYQAVNQAWLDSGMDGSLPDYLASLADDIVLGQYEHVDQLYRDIVDARLDGTPLAPLLARAPLWANQWNVAYREAIQTINFENGGNLVWRKGQTEHGCQTCADLDGIVMFASEWEELDVHPRGYPNPKLECNGGGPAGYCDCELVPTDQRRSPNAFATVMNIVTK